MTYRRKVGVADVDGHCKRNVPNCHQEERNIAEKAPTRVFFSSRALDFTFIRGVFWCIFLVWDHNKSKECASKAEESHHPITTSPTKMLNQEGSEWSKDKGTGTRAADTNT